MSWEYAWAVGPSFVQTLMIQANENIYSMNYLFDGDFKDNNIKGILLQTNTRVLYAYNQ